MGGSESTGSAGVISTGNVRASEITTVVRGKNEVIDAWAVVLSVVDDWEVTLVAVFWDKFNQCYTSHT